MPYGRIMGYNFSHMAGNAQGRAQYTVACSCGASISLDARGFGKPRPCRCGAVVTVAWGRDPKSRKAIPVAMTQKKKAAPKPSAAAPAAPPAAAPGATAPPEDRLKALCSCGNSQRVPASQRSNPPRCLCGRIMRIENAPPPVKPIGKIEKFERPKPSAPLLPLHLRAPLKARIKKDAKFFDCVCGERVVLLSVTGGRPIQCLACDRFHIVEVQGAPPPGPAPEPGAKPRGTPAVPTRPLTLGEFLCQCGEIQPPRTSRTGKNFECKKCGRKGLVEIDKDPETNLPKMRPVFTSGPKAAPPAAAAAAKPAGPAVTPGAPAWTCVCGQAMEAATVMAKGDMACPGCGRRVRLEKWKHPHSTMTMIRPVFGDPAPRKAAGDEVVSFEELPAFEGAPADFAEAAVFEVAAGSDADGAPPEVSTDAQTAICECGAEILISQADIGATIQCPACADVMTVEQTSDPRTRAPILTIRSLGSMDDADWKLEDFQ